MNGNAELLNLRKALDSSAATLDLENFKEQIAREIIDRARGWDSHQNKPAKNGVDTEAGHDILRRIINTVRKETNTAGMPKRPSFGIEDAYLVYLADCFEKYIELRSIADKQSDISTHPGKLLAESLQLVPPSQKKHRTKSGGVELRDKLIAYDIFNQYEVNMRDRASRIRSTQRLKGEHDSALSDAIKKVAKKAGVTISVARRAYETYALVWKRELNQPK